MLYSLEDPIAALATPMASSALAVIRTSGPGSLSRLSSLLAGCGDLSGSPGHTLHHCFVMDGNEKVDEVLVSVFRAPRSYTGEDGAEISCHGSLPVIRRILSLLSRAGFRPAGPGEFTQRAFLNGKMDLTRAEAVNEIVRARTDRARSLAMERLSGAVAERLSEVRGILIDLRAALEIHLDYPPEETDGAAPDRASVEKARGILDALVRGYRRGRLYQEGVTAAIAGATNSGKSSLFNALLRQDRAIVSETHGTTRDYLEGSVDLEGIPVRLFDTAGLRAAADGLEAEGIRRAEEIISGADLVIYMVDCARGVTRADEDRCARLPRAVKVWNKTDLPGTPRAPEGFISVSALTGKGLEDLEAAISRAAREGTSEETGEPLIDSERQRVLIQRALAALGRFASGLDDGTAYDLLAVDLQDALDAVGEITGEVSSSEILEKMFSSFCVGK